jgi:protein-S-isoprenylcysteine O-methyltransferase Ste14
MTALWVSMIAAGTALTIAAVRALPSGTDLRPVPIVTRTTRGPYRWLQHPMYWGNGLIIVGCAGLAAGVWNAITAGLLAELLMREWALRETGPHRKG